MRALDAFVTLANSRIGNSVALEAFAMRAAQNADADQFERFTNALKGD